MTIEVIAQIGAALSGLLGLLIRSHQGQFALRPVIVRPRRRQG